VNTQELPHAVHVTTAEVQIGMARWQCQFSTGRRYRQYKEALADGGHAGATFAAGVRRLEGLRGIAKRAKLHRFIAMPKRWVDERSFVWFDKCRLEGAGCIGFHPVTQRLAGNAQFTGHLPHALNSHHALHRQCPAFRSVCLIRLLQY
jgi:hypothetical protein